MAPYRLAIDLGTSHTVAVVRRGTDAPRPLLFDGSPLLPSAIFCEPPRLLTGRDAERLAVFDPSRFEPHPKRRVDEGTVLLGNVEVRVVDMLAELLRRVAGEAGWAVGPSGGVVLTCPADWGAHRRGVLLSAARVAGLGEVLLVDEPVAAATYCLDVLDQRVGVGETVAVFDFGGGTLDASVLRREPSGLRVLSVGGLDDLGGIDIDAALIGHLGHLISLRSPRVWQRLSNPGTRTEQRERREFWNEVRGAKEMLSRTSTAPIQVPGMDSALHLTREELERVAGPLIDRAVDETRRVLQRAGLETSALTGLFLVGGSSRIPLVASRLHARFRVAPVVPEQPELPVAYGALSVASPDATSGPPPVITGMPGSPVSPGGMMPSTMMSPVGFGTDGTAPPAPPVSGSPVSGVPVSGSPVSGSPATAGRPGDGVASPGFPPRSSVSESEAVGPLPPTGRRRGLRVRYIALILVVALVAACGWGGYTLFHFAYDAVRGLGDNHQGSSGADGDGNGSGNDGGGGAQKLTTVLAGTIPGDGAFGATVGSAGVYYANVEANTTSVTAVNPADGKEQWKVSVGIEPTELRLTVVGDLLVVDGDRAATHQGKDVRAVLETKNGAIKNISVADGQRVLGYFGTDAIVQVDRPASIRRIDLATGTVRWQTASKDQTVSFADLWSGPAMVHAPNGPTTGQGRLTGVGFPADNDRSYDVREALAADPGLLVMIDDDKKKAYVLDAGTGKEKASAAAAIDQEQWTVYGGLLIGRLDDGGGRETVAAFGLDNLGRRWEFPMPAGASVERIHPCGPKVVCVAWDKGSLDYVVDAVDLSTGRAVWSKKDIDAEPDWYLLADGLAFGRWQFTVLGEPVLVDPNDGTERGKVLSGVNGAAMMAADGKRVAMYGIGVSGTQSRWEVYVANPATGAHTEGLAVSAKQIEQMAISGNIMVALAEDRALLIARAPD